MEEQISHGPWIAQPVGQLIQDREHRSVPVKVVQVTVRGKEGRKRIDPRTALDTFPSITCNASKIFFMRLALDM